MPKIKTKKKTRQHEAIAKQGNFFLLYFLDVNYINFII